MSERVFGEIRGYPVGSRFGTRAELSEAGLHRPAVAGISGSERDGADSIVLSGGYEDDRDLGDEIVYTGHGGRDRETGRQVADQIFRGGNRALALSSLNDLPVRVIRGACHRSPESPSNGYRYDRLFLVDDYWQETGRSGFLVWRYKLIQPSDGTEQAVSQTKGGYQAATPHRDATVGDAQNMTRRSILAHYVHRCQMWGLRVPCESGAHQSPRRGWA